MHLTDEKKNDPSSPPCSCGAGLSRPVKDAKFQKNPHKLAFVLDMRHRPNESAHTHVQTGIRLLSSCSSRTEPKKSVATKFMIFARTRNKEPAIAVLELTSLYPLRPPADDLLPR